MNSSLVIEAADKSGRWYLLPGSANSYDLKLSNPSDHSILCKLNLEEPADAGTVTPSTVTLKAGESRTVSIAFKPEWLSLRDRKAVITGRNAAGTVLATFVHDLVAATTTDCSVSLGWKEEIASEGALRGFTLICTIRSISSTPGIFEPEFSPHPSLHFPHVARLTLGPGESASFEVPVIWNRTARDSEGWNHPRSIEVSVPVTHGRRAATAPWDLVQQHIEPYLTDADRAPVIARRPPPPQFTAPGGGVPPASPLLSEPSMGAVVTETPAERLARSEMEAGVTTAPGFRSAAHAPTSSASPRDRDTIAVAPGTLLIVALAIGAIAIVLILMLRQPTSTSAVTTGPVPVVASPGLPSEKAVSQPHRQKPRTKSAHPASSSAPSIVISPAAGQNAAAPPANIALTTNATAVAERAAGGSGGRAASAPQRVSPVDRSALVQLDNVGAEYQRGGRAVRVTWDSYAQASAQVQLLNDQSRIVAQTTVGRRLGALLWLPRGYRGAVYVQVTAIGYHGERVVSSTSLSP